MGEPLMLGVERLEIRAVHLGIYNYISSGAVHRRFRSPCRHLISPTGPGVPSPISEPRRWPIEA